MGTSGLFERRAPRESRILFRSALVIFVVTVVIGMLNGAGLMHFSRNELLTHVHAGTLGWITLAIFGAAMWLFAPPGNGESAGRGASQLAWFSVASTAFYVVAFWLGGGLLRPIAGTISTVAIFWFMVWGFVSRRNCTFTVPHLGLLLSLVTLATGAVFGVLLGLKLSGRTTFSGLPDGIAGAHPSMMVVGYLILAATSLIEARLVQAPKSPGESKIGVAQVVMLFAASMALSTGMLLNLEPVIGLNLPLELFAAIIFYSRMRSKIFKVEWRGRSASRLFAAASYFLTFSIGLTLYLVAQILSGSVEPENVSPSLLLTLDHVTFVGVMTNCIFGLMHEATRDRVGTWAWADHIVFWAMNLAVAGFAVSLLTEMKSLYRVFTPVMGAAILIGIAAYSVRFAGGGSPNSPEAVPAAGDVAA